MSNKKTSPKSGSRLNLNGQRWNLAMRDMAHSIIRTHGRVEIIGLPAASPKLEFKLHPVLDAWSMEQLIPASSASCGPTGTVSPAPGRVSKP
jgi:hypothetical protein